MTYRPPESRKSFGLTTRTSRLTSSFDSATGITTTYIYKPNTNYISQETVTSNLSPVTLAVYSYTYRADGLKTGEVDTTYNSDGTVNDTRTLSWQYDGLDRLTNESSSDTAGVAALNYTNAYVYDLSSNRVQETIKNGAGTVTDTITSSYNADNELTQAVDANTGTTVYTYDNNGSQIETQHTPSGGTSLDTTTTNEYDLQGQLDGTQTTNSSGTTKATYEYDDAGNRVVETNTSTSGVTTTTYYLVDTNNPTGYSQPIEQGTTPGSPQITYVWGAQLISETYATGATIPGVGTATSPTTYYLLQDAHGSTRIVTDATGKVVEDMNYDAFGDALGFNASTALTTYLYSSMPFDAASGNYYDHARYFDTGTGSFTQADYGYTGSLADPMTGLPYTYGGGDPINTLDLSGHDFTVDSLSVGIIIASSLNGIIGGVVGGLQNGIGDVIGGAVNGFSSTLIGLSTFAAIGPLSFALGDVAGEIYDLELQGKSIWTPEAKVEIALSGLFGLVGGLAGGEASWYYARGLGRRLLQIPTVRQETAEIGAAEGAHLATAVDFVEYYTAHPWKFFRITTAFVTEKSLGADAIGAARSIITGLALGKVQDVVSAALAQPIADFIGAVDALFVNIPGGSQ